MTANHRHAAPPITMIAAVARNGTIGAAGSMPWHLPEDFKRFKAITMGHTLIMGRKTYESIGRALPGRRTIVITRDAAWQAPDAEVAHSVDEALALAEVHASDEAADRQVMILGGGEIYAQFMATADYLEITEVDREVAGDTVFPSIDLDRWELTGRIEGDGLSFVSYARRPPVRELRMLLSAMGPELHAGDYVFCTIPPGTRVPAGLQPVVTVTEAEGLTLVVAADDASSAGLTGLFRCAWITLTVTSDLAAVGLTAAVAGALTTHGIACNVVAGFHHDHLFVPTDSATAAMAALDALSHAEP